MFQRFSIVPQRHRRLCVCLFALLLITTSGFTNAATRQSTPINRSVVHLYVGHGAKLTAEIPSHWEPDDNLEYDFVGRDGFIDSEPLSIQGRAAESLEAMCNHIAGADRFNFIGRVDPLTWRETSACTVRTSANEPDDPISIVLAHPTPAEDGHNSYIAVTVDGAHFDRIISTISFDLSKVSPLAYLDAAIDFIETHSLWRDAIDWAELRTEAHELFKGAREDESLQAAHAALEYVLERLQTKGADGHNWLSTSRQGASLPNFPYLVPTGTQFANGIGYFVVPGFQGVEDEAALFTSEIHAIVVRLQEYTTCGWIIDLRENNGGNMYPMLSGIAPLFGTNTEVGFRNANVESIQVVINTNGTIQHLGGPFGGESDAWLSNTARLIQVHVVDQPIAALIGPRTGSAGEATAIALAGREQTHFFGETTAGYASSPTYLRLLDGSLLSVTTHWTTGPRGAIYPEGVFPDVTVVSSTNVVNPVVNPLQDDPVVKAASAWLLQLPECRPVTSTSDDSRRLLIP